jgi:hypothetical protein
LVETDSMSGSVDESVGSGSGSGMSPRRAEGLEGGGGSGKEGKTGAKQGRAGGKGKKGGGGGGGVLDLAGPATDSGGQLGGGGGGGAGGGGRKVTVSTVVAGVGGGRTVSNDSDDGVRQFNPFTAAVGGGADSTDAMGSSMCSIRTSPEEEEEEVDGDGPDCPSDERLEDWEEDAHMNWRANFRADRQWVGTHGGAEAVGAAKVAARAIPSVSFG